MRLDFFVKFKYQSSIIIMSFGIKNVTEVMTENQNNLLRDLLCDVNNYALIRKVAICVTYGK